MGCTVKCHIKPTQQRTWGKHSGNGWYLHTLPEHYQSHIVFVKTTRSTCITDAMFFKHKYITQPTVMPTNQIVKAYQDLTQAIQGLTKSSEDAHMEALTRLENNLNHSLNTPSKYLLCNVQGWSPGRFLHQFQGCQ